VEVTSQLTPADLTTLDHLRQRLAERSHPALTAFDNLRADHLLLSRLIVDLQREKLEGLEAKPRLEAA
jgi:hypothetical protein